MKKKKEDQEILNNLESKIEALTLELKEIKGEFTEIYSRIVGYYRPCNNWNKGKLEELKDRKMFNVNKNKKNYLFIGFRCPDCLKLKEFLSTIKINFDYEEIDVHDRKNILLVQKYEILTLPTLVIEDRIYAGYSNILQMIKKNLK